ncbi:zinc finger BED domain-containing protein RICESLEEPER 2-like isoform X2 [Thalictrum thalictroides]|uniref:Zinc finger BED domain-containing protein RICESLEEPER 2-like isoform X2 n=1 Tax=Thalictrum thalictroides TaxID=46969 RepID=A0A7J6XE58_THATH|nr:zinc finger BED domain-containing protein RICESLEEPER 2-like isoform X2 [Thalictrum thalictroides]
MSTPLPNDEPIDQNVQPVDVDGGSKEQETDINMSSVEPKQRAKRSPVWQGTSRLKFHLKSCKRKKIKTSGQQLLTSVKSGNEPPKLANWKYDPEKSRLDFARMIAKHDYSFFMAEHEYFREFIKDVNPAYKFSSRNTVREDVMKIYNEKKEELQELLDLLPSKVSLTTDMWTPDHQQVGEDTVQALVCLKDWLPSLKVIVPDSDA